MHAIAPPMTGIYMPPKFDFGMDESKLTYGPKQFKTSESDAKTSDLASCESNSSVETLESVSKPVESKTKDVSEPKVWSDAPILEDYESDSDDEYVCKPSVEQETPSCAFINTVKHVKTPMHTVKDQDTSILTKTGRFPVNAARQNFSSQATSTSTVRKVNTARPIVNEIRPRNNVYKSHSPIRRPFNRTTTSKANFTNHKVNTVGDKTVSAVEGNRETAVKGSAGYTWRSKRHYWNKDNLHQTLKGKGIVDSGCSRHMIGNKAYLVEYQDFNGGPICNISHFRYLTVWFIAILGYLASFTGLPVKVNKARGAMIHCTYTSVYTDSGSGRIFLGVDKELSDGGSPRVIVYGYDGLPMMPVPPPVVAESDLEVDPEEYEKDEAEDGPVNYPMDEVDDGDDEDDDDSSGYDVDDEDEDEEEDKEEEEEHLAPADSAIVIPIDELVSLPEGTEPTAEVERLLAMPTPSPSPLTSLSPPSAGERLARCTAPAELPSPPLPTFSYPPPLVDRKDGIPESEQPPRKRLCLSTLGSRYEVGERSTKGRVVDYGFTDTVEAEMRHRGIREVGYGIRDTWIDPAEAVPDMASTTFEKVNTRVAELAELHEHDTHDLYALLEDTQDGRTRISQRVAMDSQQVDLLMGDRMTLQETQLHETHSQMQQTEMAGLRETDRLRQSQIVETLRVMRDMRREMRDDDLRVLLGGFRTRAHGDVEVRCGKGFGTVEVYEVKLGKMGE
nr:hypothetical protein [Tanacetum cinerariifolium]